MAAELSPRCHNLCWSNERTLHLLLSSLLLTTAFFRQRSTEAQDLLQFCESMPSNMEQIKEIRPPNGPEASLLHRSVTWLKHSLKEIHFGCKIGTEEVFTYLVDLSRFFSLWTKVTNSCHLLWKHTNKGRQGLKLAKKRRREPEWD